MGRRAPVGQEAYQKKMELLAEMTNKLQAQRGRGEWS